MADQFTMVGGLHQPNVFDDYIDQQTGKYAVPQVAILAAIRHHHPDMTVTISITPSGDLLAAAGAVGAVAELDITDDGFLRFRTFRRPYSEHDPGQLYDSIQFARYKYTWKNLEFILYTVNVPSVYYTLQYVLFPPDTDETVMSNSKATDALLMAVGQAQFPYYYDREYILVFDLRRWYMSRDLYFEVRKTTWDDVILDQEMKDTISHTIEEFFDNEKRYRDLDVPWKRGIIFHGPPGNGKTLSLRALMHSLSQRREHVNLLYVKSITSVWDIGAVFYVARAYAPCLLILEDIDTLVSGGFQSYFFNEVDGLANNDGIMMIATTNHLDKLDGGLANRPSRFDRKYNFPNPHFDERVLYSDFWQKKLQNNDSVDFPKELNPEIAKITADFSFAYMKEAFIATLLGLARAGPGDIGKEKKDINDLPFWKEMQKEVKILREDLRTKQEAAKIESRQRFDLTPGMNCQHFLEAPKTTSPAPFNLVPTMNRPRQSDPRFEASLPYRPSMSGPGNPSPVYSMPMPNSHSACSATALPLISSRPPRLPSVANHSPWERRSGLEDRDDMNPFGFPQRY